MAEVLHPVRQFRVTYLCDKCGKGNMETTGMVLTSNPPQYEHRCQKCDNRVTFRTQYPNLRTVNE